MRASRNTRPTFLSRLAALLLLPLMAWSVLPVSAAGKNVCPAPEAIEAAAHACCPPGPGVSAAHAHAPVAHAHGDHAGSDGIAFLTPAPFGDAPASPLAPDNCACLPAQDRPARPAELPAVTGLSPTPRVPDTCGPVFTLPAEIDLPSKTVTPHDPGHGRRTSAGPPIFLLHELLLI